MPRGFAAALAASLVLLGCGGAGVARRRSGRALFAEDCSRCHSLVGNESLRRPGGDLLGDRISHRELVQFVREMPVRHPLSPAQLAAVVDYVSAKERAAPASLP
jgi:mono/diheme cytochrome c family protein